MAISSEKKSANAVGGKTARACDSCLRRRARWFCAADDAFLCQNCDHLVHSANPLARRHERVRLKTASSSSSSSPAEPPAAPSWHQGFKRKARTPRGRHHPAPPPKSEPLVPDFESHETAEEEEEEEEEEERGGEEEQLLYRVPIFDPLLAEFCSSHASEDSAGTSSAETKPSPLKFDGSPPGLCPPLPGFSPSDVDLVEFSADVESLLGRVLDEDDFTMEGLGLVKLETSEGDDPLELNFAASPPPAKRRKIALRLDYDGVISAWSSSQGCCSPWTDGERPLVDPDDCLPDFIGLWGEAPGMGYGSGGAGGAGAGGGDGGREARVSRYREKRRTRLFSKKIRYEVRKLNAEKRPRMKGRFVKSAGATSGVAPQPAFAF